jgi:hypothetical protein
MPAILPFSAEFLCRALCVLAHRLVHVLQLRDALAKRPADDDLLLCRQRLDRDARNSVQFAYCALEYDTKRSANERLVTVRELQRCDDPHSGQLFRQLAPTSPNFVDRQQRHQLSLSVAVRQVDHTAGGQPGFRSVISEFGKRHRLGDTDPAGESRLLQNGTGFSARSTISRSPDKIPPSDIDSPVARMKYVAAGCFIKSFKSIDNPFFLMKMLVLLLSLSGSLKTPG